LGLANCKGFVGLGISRISFEEVSMWLIKERGEPYMADFIELRNYQRCSSSICNVYISKDKEKWEEIEFIDISAEGLGFASKKQFEINDRIYLNISVISGFSEFNMNFEGIIVKKQQGSVTSTYDAKFNNINKYQQIQLDEIIKNKMWQTQQLKNSVFEDGAYTFTLSPGRRKRKRIPI